MHKTDSTLAERSVAAALQECRRYFDAGKSRDLESRLVQLQNLKRMMTENASAIAAAIKSDLGRPEMETIFAETNVVIDEINVALKNLRKWARPRRVASSFLLFPSRARIVPEPFGVVLVIGPWNYPLQLLVAPLVAALAAGNCAILKPSELAPATSALICNLVARYFEPGLVTAIGGGVETSQALLAQKFDSIFFTGGAEVGKIVMRSAAEHLTPVTLELGGKSPCIVDSDVDIDIAARRIVWGKFLNAGQTCVAPDYLLVQEGIREPLLEAVKKQLTGFFGANPLASPDYGRIVNQRHFSRLSAYLKSGKIIVGGQTDPAQRYIAPTLLADPKLDDAVMQDEIFGPILPVLTYKNLDDAISFINGRPKPLALYFFSRDKTKQKHALRKTSSGGVCLNDTLVHLSVAHLPFGGVGESGMGNYHGVHGFETFSHKKAVLEKPFWFDVKLRYAPHSPSKLRFLKRFFGIS